MNRFACTRCGAPARWRVWYFGCGNLYNFLCDKCLIADRDKYHDTDTPVANTQPIGYEEHRRRERERQAEVREQLTVPA